MYLTPDGLQTDMADWAKGRDECCSPPICYDPCQAACRLVSSLPSGPMWDTQKQRAMDRLRTQQTGFDLCSPLVDCDTPTCGSLIDYAVFLAQFLSSMIEGSLWTSNRESNPFTARDTVLDWQKRLGWEECFRSSCRSTHQGEITPYEIPGPDGPIYCPPRLPDALECALQSGIVKALARLRLGTIANLDGINWAIEPLGAQLKVYSPGVDEFGDVCEEQDCCGVRLTVCPIDGMIDSCSPGLCTDPPAGRIPACVDRSCTGEIGQSSVVWPGVIAAECIVRSFFPTCDQILFPCNDPQWDTCAVPAREWPLEPEPAFGECAVGPRVYTNLCGPTN